MKNLPNWVLTNKFPAFYDTESGSAIEQTAKVYGAMQELIKEHNEFIANITNSINDFKGTTEKEIDEFKTCITNTLENYIKMLDVKIEKMDKHIEEYVDEYFKSIINDKNIKAIGTYNTETESLNIDLVFVEDGGNE